MASLVSGRNNATVIIRVANGYASPYGAKERVWEDSLTTDQLWLVLVNEQAQLVASRTLVVQLKGKGAS